MPSPTGAGGIGLWAGFLDRLPAAEAIATARRIEDAGVRTIWLQEYSGVDPFVRAALYLSATRDLVVALGVAVIHGRDPEAMVAVASTLEEAFPGRFVLGLGGSHKALVEARGHTFTPPLATMRTYLAAMDAARGHRRLPTRVLGALGPKMMELAGTAADGAHTYFTPVAHTAAVRAALGPDRWLAPTQMVGLDPGQTRDYLQLCLGMPNYTQTLLRFGLEQADLDTTSDRLVDALVVPADAVTDRVAEQRAAGADQVVLQFVPPPPAEVVLERVEKGLT
ncbi:MULTISPECIES: LLM class flavin-dependent oxidoreductase [Pseudofrankia]|uniref:LLM class flavin-dependent oxidoreductase n=1 Tax=Pseudofrankia TaxID=2994363 RepID=UPI000234DA61|nr:MULTISPECIES: LLM class flavin-dependent oxidoreductase [Pseudofrankia]OHV32274.1 luciferase [Pseudofrankia sp. EUN1h]